MTQYRVLFGLIALVVLAACDGSEMGGETLAEGDHAPGFTLPSASGENVELSDFLGEKPVLLYFSMGPG